MKIQMHRRKIHTNTTQQAQSETRNLIAKEIDVYKTVVIDRTKTNQRQV